MGPGRSGHLGTRAVSAATLLGVRRDTRTRRALRTLSRYGPRQAVRVAAGGRRGRIVGRVGLRPLPAAARLALGDCLAILVVGEAGDGRGRVAVGGRMRKAAGHDSRRGGPFMIRRLLAYRRLAGRDAACGALLLLMASAFELLQPWPIKGLVDYVFGNRPAPDWLARIWPAFARHDASGEALGVCLAILLLAVLHRLAATASQFLLVRAGWSLVHQLRCGVSDHVHRLSLAYHDRSKVGDSLYRIAYDSHAAQSLVTNALVPMGTAIVTLTGIVLIMLRLDVWLTLAAIAVMPVFWRLIHRFGQSIERHSQRYHEQESRLVSATQESLSSIRIVQAFTQEPVVAAAFHELGDGSRMTNQRLTAVQLLFSASVGLTMAAGTAIVVWLGSQAVLADRLSVGDILVFLAYLGMVYQPLNSLSQGTNVYHLAKAQLKRVFELLDAPVDVADRPGAVQPVEVRGRLELCEVDFGYSPGRAVLRGIDLTIEPGQVVGLVGRTGAGKSTLAALLLRFFDPESGKILLDGRDFRDLKLAWLRRQVSIVL